MQDASYSWVHPIQRGAYSACLLPFLGCSANFYHLPCMVVTRSNCSCMVDTESALQVAAMSMRLINIWPAWTANMLTIYQACLSLSIPCEAKEGPGQHCAALAMAAISIWLIRERISVSADILLRMEILLKFPKSCPSITVHLHYPAAGGTPAHGNPQCPPLWVISWQWEAEGEDV